jgi:lipoprotein-anchoring transpeptidase ErfK/SrfK
MHGALRSLIIPCVISAMALGGSSSLQAREGELAEPSAQVQVQEQPAQAAPEQAQGKEQIQEQLATQSEAAPEQSSPSQPAEPREQQASHATPEQSAQQTPEPTAKVDLSSYEPGTIVVETSERKLHLVLGQGEMLTYPVGVGKSGKSWAGTGAIRGKFLRPAWSPPRALKREKPWTPDYIPGGSPKNPMGAAAMTLNVDQYAIHGTNDPGSIGGFVSFGCIRMHNRDILDLYKRVHVGTRVVVLR